MQTEKKATAILIMGTFNPITCAHVALGSEAGKYFPDADVIYVPSNLSFMKGWKNVEDDFISDDERIALIRESVKVIPKASVTDIEIAGESDGRTYNTVQLIKDRYNEVVIVMGIDKLDELDRWYNADRLFTENKVLVFERNGENLESMMTDFIRERRDNFIAAPMQDFYENISSTAVRDAYRNDELSSIREYVPEYVYDFLSDKRNKI